MLWLCQKITQIKIESHKHTKVNACNKLDFVLSM